MNKYVVSYFYVNNPCRLLPFLQRYDRVEVESSDDILPWNFSFISLGKSELFHVFRSDRDREISSIESYKSSSLAYILFHSLLTISGALIRSTINADNSEVIVMCKWIIRITVSIFADEIMTTFFQFPSPGVTCEIRRVCSARDKV